MFKKIKNFFISTWYDLMPYEKRITCANETGIVYKEVDGVVVIGTEQDKIDFDKQITGALNKIETLTK